MLIRKKKTNGKQPEKKPGAVIRHPEIGSGWVPGLSDGSWLRPERLVEQHTNGVWGPVPWED